MDAFLTGDGEWPPILSGPADPAHLSYADAFRLLVAAWGSPRRDLESPYWASRDRACLVCCASRPGFGSQRAGALVIRCYSERDVPFHFLAVAGPCDAAMAVSLLAELDVGNFNPGSPARARSGLRRLAPAADNRADARAAARRARDLRAHSRALLATGRIAAGVSADLRSRRPRTLRARGRARCG